MKRFPFDQRKFQELVLYLSDKSREDRRFGNIKLNKLLYYSDFNAYRLLGRPVTGAEYRKYSEGPAPAPMTRQRRIMTEAGLIRTEARWTITGNATRTVPLRKPDGGIFAPEELILIGEALQAMRDMSEREAVSLSRQETGCRAARNGEIIPYETAWLSPGPLEQAAEEWYLSQGKNSS